MRCPCTALLLLLAPTIVVGQAAGTAAGGVRIARIDPNVVHLDVVDASDIRFSRLSHTKGISQTRVSSIVQDGQGFLWFATQYGLNRYDGYTLRRFKHVDGDPASVTDSFVRILLRDRDGRLWVGSTSIRSLDRYDPVTETFIHYSLGIQTPSVYAASVRDISQDGEGLLWVSTGVGLYRFDPSTGITTAFHHRDGDPTSLSGDIIHSSGVDRRGTLWVATHEGLDGFDRATGRVTLHVPLREAREPREMSFYEDRSGTFWIIHSSGDGLAVLDRETGVVTQYSFAQHPHDSDDLAGVSSMIEDAQGQLWVGTHSDGLLRLDPGRHRATRYRNDPFDANSLSENRVTTLARDREGEIWVGLGASEPNHFSPQPGPFQSLPFDASNPANLGEKLVNALYEDPAGTLWVGTTGALERYDRSRGRFERVAVPGTGDCDVLSIIEFGSALWVGTSGQGLVRIDPATRTSKLYRHRSGDPTSLSNDWVTHFLIDHAGSLWLATLDGLNRYEPAADRFRTFRAGASGSAVHTSISEDAHGGIWISGPNGLLHFDPVTEQFLTFKEGLPANGWSVLAASTGDIWAGSQSGLYRFNLKTHTTRVYSDRDGMASNAVSCLLEDSGGDIWMSTTEGVSKLSVASGRFRNYTVEDGLPGHDMTGWSACFRGRGDRLYFGGFAGAVAFDPLAVVDNPYTPQVVLTGLELAGIPVQLGHQSLLQRAIGYTRDLTLSSSERTFAIEFAALSFRSPGTNRYRYRLVGLDSSWHEVDSERRIAGYTTLPAGDYTFQVQGATNRSPWSEPGATLHITVEAPWWARWEFRALFAAIALALAVSVYMYRVRSITRALKIRFDERVRERTRIARDLHDSLLQGFQGLTLKFHALAHSVTPGSPLRESLEGNLRQARELIEEVRTRVRELRTQDEPTPALEDLLQDFRDIFPRASSAAFEVKVVGRTRSLDRIAFEELLHIGREAISNAVSHAEAGRIEVEVTYRDKDLTLSVSDDGKGMDAKILASGRPDHWGLHGMRERARSLGAALEVWSRPGAGTEVQLVVPGAVAYGRKRRAHPGTTLMMRLRRAIRGR